MARGVNKALLIGNLGNDPEVRYTPNGNAIANVVLATSSAWRDKTTGELNERTEWHRIVFFNRLAEIVNEYLRKGSKIYIEGSLRTRKWQDKSGIDRYTTEIIANEMQILDNRNTGNGPGSQHSDFNKDEITSDAVEGFDEDIPFQIMHSLQETIKKHQIIVAPGAYDGLSARLVEQAGFQAVYASGGAIARSCGFPDIGLITFTEMCQRLQHMREVTTIPIIADADTGFGNEVNVRRTIKEYKRIGISACHIEDQVFPKRCGHLEGKHLIPTDEMVLKVEAAKQTAGDDFMIIARTDAIAVESFDQAIERAQRYVEAGADMIFVEAPTSAEQIEKIAEFIKTPKLINMFHGGKTPIVPVDKLKKLGYQLVIIPSDLQRAAIRSMQQTLDVIKRDGDSSAISDQLASFNEREQIIDTQSYLNP